MIVPVLLFVLSLAGVAAAYLQPGLADLILLAAPCALASLILVLRGIFFPPPADRWPQQRDVPSRPRPVWRLRPKISDTNWFGRRPAKRWILVDGSNVMHWRDGVPQIATVKAVTDHLIGQGLTPLVMFDANAGYKIGGHYTHDAGFSRLLGIPERQVLVVSKGTPADPVLLAQAREIGARIVTNDRYRDWAEAHPEVHTPGHLVRGNFRDGALWLNLAEDAGAPDAGARNAGAEPARRAG